MSLKPDSDPYVCFRRREIKPLRKARRGDVQALDKLARLRDDLLRVRQILDLVGEREATRRDAIHSEHLIFEKRIAVRRMKKHLGVPTTERDPDATPEHRKKKLKRFDEFDESGYVIICFFCSCLADFRLTCKPLGS